MKDLIGQDLEIFIDEVKELRDASKPFTSGDIVDETDGTIPFMERLENAIKRIDDFIPYEVK